MATSNLSAVDAKLVLRKKSRKSARDKKTNPDIYWDFL